MSDLLCYSQIFNLAGLSEDLLLVFDILSSILVTRLGHIFFQGLLTDLLSLCFLYGIYVALKYVLISDNFKHKMYQSDIIYRVHYRFCSGEGNLQTFLFYYIMSSPNFPTVLCSAIIADHIRTHFKPVPLTAGLINNISGI